ncbi:MAG: hypothetical protein AABY34_06220 [Pseudomonadota bacterium]
MSEQEKNLDDYTDELMKQVEERQARPYSQQLGDLMADIDKPLPTLEETSKQIKRDIHEESENTRLRVEKEIQELTKNSKKITIQDEAERVELNRQRFNKLHEIPSRLSEVNQGKSTFDLLEMLGVKKPSQQARPEQREANIDIMAKEENKEMAQAKQKREAHQDKLAKQNTVSEKAAQKATASENADTAKVVVADSAIPFQAPTPQPPSK